MFLIQELCVSWQLGVTFIHSQKSSNDQIQSCFLCKKNISYFRKLFMHRKHFSQKTLLFPLLYPLSGPLYYGKGLALKWLASNWLALAVDDWQLPLTTYKLADWGHLLQYMGCHGVKVLEYWLQITQEWVCYGTSGALRRRESTFSYFTVLVVIWTIT